MQSESQNGNHFTAVRSSMLGKRARASAQPKVKGESPTTLEASMATTTSGTNRPEICCELTLEKYRRMEQKLCEL